MGAVTTAPACGKRPWHEALEHGAERELWVHARTWPELVAQAGCAVGEQLLGGSPAVPSSRWRELEIAGADRENSLIRWLNELLYRAAAEWWIPVEFADVHTTDAGISARARGVRLTEPPLFRAVTEECVRIRQVPEGFEAKIMLHQEEDS